MASSNKVMRITLSGGLIGLLGTNPRRTLDNAVDKANQDGWRVVQVIPYSDRNLLMLFLSVLVLVVTIGLYTFGAGYLIVLERELQR